MSDFLGRVVWLLIFIRDQCMPVPIGDEPGVIDYSIVALAAVGVVAGTVWFAWGLTGRDTAQETRVKAQVLED